MKALLIFQKLFGKRNDDKKSNILIRKIQTRLDDTSKDFDKLVGTRTRMLASKLKSVEAISPAEATQVLGLPVVDSDASEEE